MIIEATIVKTVGKASKGCVPLELARHGEGKRAVGLKRERRALGLHPHQIER